MSTLAKTAFVLALSAAALSAGTLQASALVVANGATPGPGNFTFTSSDSLVPIRGANTTLPFTLPTAAKVAITFSAECAVEGGTPIDSWVDIDIQVDGVAVPPTAGNVDTFCTSHFTPFQAWTHPSVTVVKSLSAGPHILTILGRRNGSATKGWIADTSTVIER